MRADSRAGREEWKEGETAQQFFYGGGYAPVTMQMLMVRYWATHGSPRELAIYPEGRVCGSTARAGQNFVWRKGGDVAAISGGGLDLGARMALVSTRSRILIAAVTTDAEFDHFEAIREDTRTDLKTFVGAGRKRRNECIGANVRNDSGQPRGSNIALVAELWWMERASRRLRMRVVLVKDGRVVKAGTRSEVEIPKNSQLVLRNREPSSRPPRDKSPPLHLFEVCVHVP